MISEVPAGVTFTAGARDGSGNWVLQPPDLAGLQMILPAAFADNFTLAVAARAVETSNFSLASTHQTVEVQVTQAPSADIVVRASGDSYKGAAVFGLSVNGAKVGQSVSVEASHKAGQWQDFVFSLAKGVDPKKVEIRYENDGGDSGGDRNLYVQYMDVKGKRLEPTAGQYRAHRQDNADRPGSPAVGRQAGLQHRSHRRSPAFIGREHGRRHRHVHHHR